MCIESCCKNILCTSTAGVWSCPTTTGERPPPCLAATFTTVDYRRAVLFGGENEKYECMNDVYIFDLQVMVQPMHFSS